MSFEGFCLLIFEGGEQIRPLVLEFGDGSYLCVTVDSRKARTEAI